MFEQDGDAGAARDAEMEQVMCELVGAGVELGVREGVVVAEERGVEWGE